MSLMPRTNPAVYAKEVVRAMLEHRRVPEPPAEEFYQQKLASFVSIKKDGELRGCIGTLEPVEPNLGHEIMRNARSAAFADPRFPAVSIEEFPRLIFSVDVLSTSESVNGPHQLDCETYGIIVSCDYRRGVLLPDLEGVESVEQQLTIACQKAGIAAHERFQVERFTVDRYHEEWEP